MSATPRTYLHIPSGSDPVVVRDNRNDDEWQGWVHDGLIHDASGIIAPEDIGDWFDILRDGKVVSEEFQIA